MGVMLVLLGLRSRVGLPQGAIVRNKTTEPASVDPVTMVLRGLTTRNRCMVTEKETNRDIKAL